MASSKDDQAPHSTPDQAGSGVRAHDRYPVTWHARLTCPDWESAERIATANVSSGGMFVRTQHKVDLGQPVEIFLDLPGKKRSVIRATVRHIVDPATATERGLPPGIGVEVTEDCRKEMAALVEIARMRQNKPPEGADSSTAAPPPTPAAAAAPPPPPTPPVATTARAPVEHTASFPGGTAAAVIGIDFGVSYCSAAVAVDETVHMLPDEQGRTLFPSVVGFPEQSPSRIVGWAARRLQLSRPDRTLASVKRVIGRRYSDPEVGGYLHSAPFSAVAGPDDTILLDVDGEQYAVLQICAELFTMLRELAEKRIGRPVTKAVVNTPIAFGQEQRKAIVRAAKLARLDVASLVEEPLASALAHRAVEPNVGERVVVYDFGGGTFDFTALDLSGPQPKLLASQGDAWLGGDDFDETLANAVANAFWRRTEIQIHQRAVAWQRLLFAAEQTKRRLSVAEQAQVEVPGVAQGIDLTQALDRATFRRVCTPLLHRSLEVCRTTLAKAGFKPEQATALVVSGGTTRIPFIREALEEFFQREIKTPVSPDHAVALGCALLGANGAGHKATRVVSPPEA